MALPSLFRERLEQMEDTRNQRLSLLEAERELQITKTQFLSTKLANIRSLEQHCLKLEQRIASRKFAISSLKADMDSLESKYDDILQQIRYGSKIPPKARYNDKITELARYVSLIAELAVRVLHVGYGNGVVYNLDFFIKIRHSVVAEEKLDIVLIDECGYILF